MILTIVLFMFIDHTMLRIKDPKASLKFYTEVLGMELIRESPGGDFVSPASSTPIALPHRSHFDIDALDRPTTS